MTSTLWIVLGISVLAIIGFVLVIRSQLSANKELDKNYASGIARNQNHALLLMAIRAGVGFTHQNK